MSDGAKESYFKALFNKEFPVKLEDLDNLPVQKHILHLIRTTNEDGTKRALTLTNEDGTKRAFKCEATHSSISSTEAVVSCLALSAVDSKLNPFRDYTSAVTTETLTNTTTLTKTGKHSLAGQLLDKSPTTCTHCKLPKNQCLETLFGTSISYGKHSLAGQLLDKSPTTCTHCKLPKNQCLETLFGTSISHYLKKVATTNGVIYYGEDDEDHREFEKVVLDDFKRLLTQLKFAVAVMNGTSLPKYPENAENPYILKGSGCEDRPLPECIVKGSYGKFMWWLSDQKTVHEWGYDISGYDICDDIEEVDIPMCVVNFYREQSGLGL